MTVFSKILAVMAATTMLSGAALADQISLTLLPELTPYESVATNADGVPIFRLCTGSKGFDYNRMAHVVAASADPEAVDVQVVNVGGSWTQLAALSENSCDGVIIQPDAGVVATRMGADVADVLLYGAKLHPEFFISACGRDNAADEFSDMQSNDDTVVIVGSADPRGNSGSGTAVTIRGFQDEDGGYKRPTYRYAESLMQAARMVAGGQADCLAMTSGLNGSAWADMDDRYGAQIRIVEAEDGDFNDTKDLKGQRLYSWADIPAETDALNDLLAWKVGRSPSDVGSVMMRAVFASRSDYPNLDAADAVTLAAESASIDFDLENYGLRHD
jgi:TRAP-type uncharacterized transport system substrate-binding protein